MRPKIKKKTDSNILTIIKNSKKKFLKIQKVGNFVKFLLEYFDDSKNITIGLFF